MNIVKKFLAIVLIVCMALSTACSLGNGIKKITLKNKKVINSDEYIEDLEQYSKIYLFSGISVTPMPKNDNLIVISKEQLFEYLNNNFSDDSYFGQRLNKIYKLEN